MAVRTVHYRGNAGFGWEGVYTELPQVGALLPYADDAEHLIKQQFNRYEAWLAAMDRAGVERRHFAEAGGAQGVSFWSWQAANSKAWAAITEAEEFRSPAPWTLK